MVAWTKHLVRERNSEAHIHINTIDNELANAQEEESAWWSEPESWSFWMVCVSSLLLVALTDHLLRTSVEQLVCLIS
jgi:hypothetical protein